MENHTIISKGKIEDAILNTIRKTVIIFEDCIKMYPSQKPTCDQILYIRDVKYLLALIEKYKHGNK